MNRSLIEASILGAALISLSGCACISHEHGGTLWIPSNSTALIYDGAAPSTYRLCVESDEPGNLTIKNENGSLLPLRFGHEKNCMDVRAMHIEAIADARGIRIVYQQIDGTH